ncbi:hypothetical protein [Micromonospora sp. CA-246542]|uniref:hypothetical protein n=1 Tax=Micromonospora sp. CA-246542 TaxID=3239959 RepID=UPI003D8A76A3
MSTTATPTAPQHRSLTTASVRRRLVLVGQKDAYDPYSAADAAEYRTVLRYGDR